MRIEVPKRLLSPDKLEKFIEWLMALSFERAIDRKIVLCEWCNITGQPLTKELVDRVYQELG